MLLRALLLVRVALFIPVLLVFMRLAMLFHTMFTAVMLYLTAVFMFGALVAEVTRVPVVVSSVRVSLLRVCGIVPLGCVTVVGPVHRVSAVGRVHAGAPVWISMVVALRSLAPAEHTEREDANT